MKRVIGILSVILIAVMLISSCGIFGKKKGYHKIGNPCVTCPKVNRHK